MFRLSTYLLVIACVFINANYGQQLDPSICPGGATPAVANPLWRPVPDRFELTSEVVSGSEVWELSQAFSKARDAIFVNTPKGALQFFTDFSTGEQFQVINLVLGGIIVPKCFRETLTGQAQTSVISPGSLLIKPSILLGYDAVNKPNAAMGFVSDGTEQIRGIPVNRFKSCFYVNDIQATVSALYRVSDPTKFVPYLGANQTIFLQIEVNIAAGGKTDTFSYNILRYTPEPRRREERLALSTPAGVFCPNRTATLAVPANIPDSSSANAELLVPDFNASIISSRNLYNTNFQYSISDVWYVEQDDPTNWHHLTDFHDFAVGVSYRFNHSSYRCRVRELRPNSTDAVPVDGSPDLLEMASPQHLFLLDDMDYRYTGERRCRDRIWCHVWIGEKTLPNNTVEHREWHWAAVVNDEPLQQWIPTKLVIRRSYNEVPMTNIELNIYNYRPFAFGFFEVDYTLANCYRAEGPSDNFNLAVLSFNIVNDKNYPVLQNQNSLRRHIFETLIFAMFVRPIRISHLTVDKNGTDIVVTFTVLDAPPRTGPVEIPFKEDSLDTIIDRLSKVIDADALAFRAPYGTKTIILRARGGSLNVGHRSSNVITKSSGPKITGLWIGLIIVGLVLGAVGGFFVLRSMANK